MAIKYEQICSNFIESCFKLEIMIYLDESYIYNLNNQIGDLVYESELLRIKDIQIVIFINCEVIHAL